MAESLDKLLEKDNEFIEDFVLFRECVKRDPYPEEHHAVYSFAQQYIENRDRFNLESYGLRTAMCDSDDPVPKPEVTLREIYSAYAKSLSSVPSRITDRSSGTLESICTRKENVMRKFAFEEQMISQGYEKDGNHYRKTEGNSINLIFPEGISDNAECNNRFGLSGSYSFMIKAEDESRFLKTTGKITDTQVGTVIGSMIGLGLSFIPAALFGAEPESLGFALSIGGSFGLGSYVGHMVRKHVARNAAEAMNTDYLHGALYSPVENDVSILGQI